MLTVGELSRPTATVFDRLRGQREAFWWDDALVAMMLMVGRRMICSDDYDWYLETQVEVAKETGWDPAKSLQMYLPGLTPGVSFEIESF
ncbi:hypothetical protein [Stieleria varia]|uniref:hypothetical protein n=1 Tax=Stieleria varia TaxID=2528005 RepID=UPI0011B7530B|nr:hypothetical protein [Stieleria varia]